MGSGNDKGQEARLWGPDNQGKSAARPKSGAAAPGVSAPRHWRSGRETFGGTNMVHRRFAACDLSNKGEAQSGGAITLQAQEKNSCTVHHVRSASQTHASCPLRAVRHYSGTVLPYRGRCHAELSSAQTPTVSCPAVPPRYSFAPRIASSQRIPEPSNPSTTGTHRKPPVPAEKGD